MLFFRSPDGAIDFGQESGILKAQLEITVPVMYRDGLNFRVRQHSKAVDRRIGCFHVPNGSPCEDLP